MHELFDVVDTVSMRFRCMLMTVGLLVQTGCLIQEAPPPPPRFGSALHADPSSCGQPSYAWLDDERLGQVLEREAVRIFEVDDSAGSLDTLRETHIANVAHTPLRRVFLDRIRYLTQDRGQLVEATALYAFPDPDEVDGELPLVIYTHGTSGYSDLCAPSHDAESPTASEAAIIGVFASVFSSSGGGAIVVAPDYLGMNGFGAPATVPHAYFVAEPTAIASLDAAHAALELARQDELDVQGVVVGGASQGGHAAALTVRYAPHYAADLHLVGSVSAIPPLDLVGHAELAMSSAAVPLNIGNLVAVLISAQRWYELPRAALLDIVDEAAVDAVEASMQSSCHLPQLDLPLDEIFAPDVIAAAQAGNLAALPEPWGCIFARSSLPDTDIERLDDTPGLVVVGSEDTLVDAAVERRDLTTLCEQGQSLAFTECAGRNHEGTFLAAIDDMLDFLEARVAAAPMVDACVAAEPGLCGSDPER